LIVGLKEREIYDGDDNNEKIIRWQAW